MEAKGVSSAQALVQEQYVKGLQERQSNPDRVFYDGEYLQTIDPGTCIHMRSTYRLH